MQKAQASYSTIQAAEVSAVAALSRSGQCPDKLQFVAALTKLNFIGHDLDLRFVIYELRFEHGLSQNRTDDA